MRKDDVNPAAPWFGGEVALKWWGARLSSPELYWRTLKLVTATDQFSQTLWAVADSRDHISSLVSSLHTAEALISPETTAAALQQTHEVQTLLSEPLI